MFLVNEQKSGCQLFMTEVCVRIIWEADIASLTHVQGLYAEILTKQGTLKQPCEFWKNHKS